MKFPKINALIPTGEHFDGEAVNEGIWMTAAHVTAIEGKLTTNEAAATQAATQLATAQTARETAETNLATANSTIASQATELTQLKAENAKLKGQPAGGFSTTTKDADPPAPADASKAEKGKYHTPYDDQRAAMQGK